MERLTKEELEEWRFIIQTFPKEEREKWKILVKSGRLLSLVQFLDSTTTTLEKLGVFGVWLNKVVKGLIYIVLAVLMIKVMITGEVSLGEVWKLFSR